MYLSIIGDGIQSKNIQNIIKRIKDIKIQFILSRKKVGKVGKVGNVYTKNINDLLNSKIIYICVPPKLNIQILKRLYNLNYKNLI